MAKYKYNHLKVPDDPILNAKWREETIHLASQNHPNVEKFRHQIRECCRKDFWYWAKGFAYLHEPRILDDDADDADFNTKIPFCIAAGTLVVTDRGPISIETVSQDDLVWDGDSWVSQGGALYRGNKLCIIAYGIHLTPDHKILTQRGWQNASEGFEREDIRLPNGYREELFKKASGVAMPVRLRKADDRNIRRFTNRGYKKLWPFARANTNTQYVTYSDMEHVAIDDCQMPKTATRTLSLLRWAWCQGMRSMESVCELLGGHGNSSRWNDHRSYRQRRKLRDWELPMGNPIRTAAKQTTEKIRYAEGSPYRFRNGRNCRMHNTSNWSEDKDDVGQRGDAFAKTKEQVVAQKQEAREVYDLINCGPRRAFTVLDDTGRPLLAHNCPWPHQIPIANHILKVLGKRDVRLVKSRAQGASWLIVLITIWLWLFRRGAKVNLVSKDMDAADKPGDMDSLGAKAFWLLEALPEWMTGTQRKDWNRNKSDHTFTRMDGETAITFYACTANVATGGRALVFFMDEHGKHPRPQDRDAMASTQPISRCRICVSTPFGMSGEFAKIIHDNTISEPVLVLAWWDNPTQNRGLYHIVKGKPVAVDEEKYGPLLPEYLDYEKWTKLKERLLERGYDLSSDKYHSPWYDGECLRQGANPVLISQEYDMAFGSEGAQYFAEALVNRLKNFVRRPIKGEFSVNPESLTGKWTENPDGRLKLWCELDIRGNPPMGEYVVANDVSAGLGGSSTSNSATCVFNRRTGKKVASFASPSIIPYELAELSIALCRWFVNYKGDPAFLIWEANGYGGEFTKRVERTNFQNYYRRKAKDSPMIGRSTDKAGYWTYKRSLLLGPYREALLEGHFDNPEHESLEELRQYQMGPDGEPYHVGEADKTDPSGAKGAHGDRTIAEALSWEASCSFGDQLKSRNYDNKPNVMNATENNVPRESFAWRRAQYLKEFRKKKNETNW